jgi:hypothetical protein
MDRVTLWVLVACGGGILIWIGWYFSTPNRLKRELKNARRFTLRELPEGTRARVIGQTRMFARTLEAPLTGRRCVYFLATVEQHHSAGRSSYWKTIIREEAGVPFILDDSTGHALVDPVAAKMVIDVDGRGDSGTFDDPTPREEQFLARHGTRGHTWLFNKRLRYREAVIEIGETVAVLGEGIREPDPDAAPQAAYRGEAPTRVRLTSSSRFPLLISDNTDTTR